MTAQAEVETKVKKTMQVPKKFKVIFLNDDKTPMEWVVTVLTSIFKHSKETAEQIMLTVHNEGSAVAGVFSYEIAEQKVAETYSSTRANGFPLRLEVEEE